MLRKQGPLEDVYGKNALQDPRDMVKATLPESQSPVILKPLPRLPRLSRGHRQTGYVSVALNKTESHPSSVYPPVDGRWAMSPFKGTNETPTSRYYVRMRGTAGSPTGRESYGDGVPIVVRERESRSHGEGGQVL